MLVYSHGQNLGSTRPEADMKHSNWKCRIRGRLLSPTWGTRYGRAKTLKLFTVQADYSMLIMSGGGIRKVVEHFSEHGCYSLIESL